MSIIKNPFFLLLAFNVLLFILTEDKVFMVVAQVFGACGLIVDLFKPKP